MNDPPGAVVASRRRRDRSQWLWASRPARSTAPPRRSASPRPGARQLGARQLGARQLGARQLGARQLWARQLWARLLGALLLAPGFLFASCAHAPTAASGVQLRDLDGKPAGLTTPGRVVLVDFWATWCEPCRVAAPIYAQFAAELGPRGLTVVAVSIDDDAATVRDALSHAAARPFRELIDPRGVAAEGLGASVMPTTLLLDRAGTVRFKHDGFAPKDVPRLRAELEQLLAERAP